MSLKKTYWYTTKDICCGSLPAQVFLGTSTYPEISLSAILLEVKRVQDNNCREATYRYTFQYEKDDLPANSADIISDDIEGFACDGIWRSVVDQRIRKIVPQGEEIKPFIPLSSSASGSMDWDMGSLSEDDCFYTRMGDESEIIDINFRAHAGVTSGVASTDLIIDMPDGLVLTGGLIYLLAVYVNAGTGPFVGFAYTDVASNQIKARKADSSGWAIGANTGFALSGRVRVAP